MITGEMFLSGARKRGAGTPFHAVEAATGAALEPAFGGATAEDVEVACAAAAAAFDAYRERAPEDRARFLDAIAEAILALGPELIERCMAETGLPRARLEGERGRTVTQLRLFAGQLRDAAFAGLCIDPALPERTPLPRPDLRRRNVPLGPVAVFGASNFPLAFSVAGGDTASALAAGCPVVVKAHPAHPGTSELVGQAIARAAADCAMPAGIFSLLFDGGLTVGQALAAHPRIAAVAFTGSRRGGEALMRIAAARPTPIPVYAEMGSLNPVILLPAALEARGAEIGRAFAASLTLGVGQFCTNPGLILAIPGPGLDSFIAAASSALAGIDIGPMLTPSIAAAYRQGAAALASHAETLTQAASGSALFATTAQSFRAEPHLREEVFGPASLVVRCRDLAEMSALLEEMEGQLTAALHLAPADHPAARSLLPILERKVGRILVNGFGTGVEVCRAMVHGGPYPATSDGRSTSVGTLAVERFLRPVCYQDLPPDLLPAALRD